MVQLIRLWVPQRPDEKVQTIAAQRDRPHILGDRADLLTDITTEQQTRQRHHPIPQPERQGDLHGTAETERNRPEYDRHPKIVQAEDKAKDKKLDDHIYPSFFSRVSLAGGLRDRRCLSRDSPILGRFARSLNLHSARFSSRVRISPGRRHSTSTISESGPRKISFGMDGPCERRRATAPGLAPRPACNPTAARWLRMRELRIDGDRGGLVRSRARCGD